MTKPQGRPEPRVPVSIPVATPDGGDPAVTKNISMGGLFLITRQRFTVGAEVALVLECGGMELEVTGRVTHHQADGVGISFVDPSPLLHNILREQIDALLSQHSLGEDTNPRIPVRQKVPWSRGGAAREQAEVRQISSEGAFLASEAQVRKDETVYVYLPGYLATDRDKASEVRGVEARVIYVRDDGFGVRFINASAEFRMAVAHLLTTRSGTKA